MRHSLDFDGLQVLDIGRSVPMIQIDHDEICTPASLEGSVADFLVRQHQKMRAVALDLIIQQHSLLFPYEDGDEAKDRLDILVSDAAAPGLPDDASAEGWQVGDALRLELVLKSPELKLIDHTPAKLTEFAITEMTRNAYRRLHALELPLAEWFFSVFLQTTQPTQLPLDILYNSAIEHKRLTPVEAAVVMKENATFWKSELQSLGNQYLLATQNDPRLMTLQNAALYQQLKRFFGEKE